MQDRPVTQVLKAFSPFNNSKKEAHIEALSRRGMGIIHPPNSKALQQQKQS
jgi:hypothetical protein